MKYYNNSDVNRYFDACTNKIPPLNVWEYNDRYEVEVELPGFSSEEVSMQVKEHTLIIKSTDKLNVADAEEGKKYLYKENNAKGTFERQLIVPDDADESKIKASMKNGMLTVVVPKKEEEQPKSIEIA